MKSVTAPLKDEIHLAYKQYCAERGFTMGVYTRHLIMAELSRRGRVKRIDKNIVGVRLNV